MHAGSRYSAFPTFDTMTSMEEVKSRNPATPITMATDAALRMSYSVLERLKL